MFYLFVRNIRCLFFIATAFTAIFSYAIPAQPGITTLIQSDGTPIRVQLIGDEHFHYYLSDDNLLLVETDGLFYFAQPDADGKPVASPYRAQDSEKRSSSLNSFLATIDQTEMLQSMAISNTSKPRRAQGLFVDATFPTTGKQKSVVILVEYQDVKFRLSNPYDYFSRMLNEEGFSDYGGTGSARDYFLKASGGLFEPQFDVFGPVTLPYNMAYYGANTGGRDGVNAAMMVVHACEALDSQIDFREYDRDNDGMIDNVFLFYAGYGESSGGGADAVWPHSADTPYGGTYDGKGLRRYGCTNEWVNRGSSSGRPDGIGAFCHEFGHILGLPDLYVTQTVTPQPVTPGAWSLMDRGSYNNDGCTPPELDLFSRNALDWCKPNEITGQMDARLAPLANSGNGFIIKTANENEFFLLENRQRCGWDRFVPGHGMLVWHIDYEPGVWSMHAVNNNPDHQHVDILEADNIQSETSRSGDAFAGAAHVTSITATTAPALVCWNGTAVDLPITAISELPDGTVTFKVQGGALPAKATHATTATEVTPRSFIAHWNKSDVAQNYRLYVFTRNGDTTETVAGYDFRNVGNATAVEVIGLQPATRYFYTVTVETGSSSSPQSNEIEVLTAELTHEYIIPEGLAAIDLSDNGFTAVWEPVEGADNYEIRLESRQLTGTEELREAFDDKTMLWHSNSSTYYSSTSYVGQSAPSLRMVGGNYIASPVLERGTIRSFGFWHRAHGTDDAARLHIELYAHDCWGLWRSMPVTTEKGGAIISINDFPDDVDAVRLVFCDANPNSTLYVDDFVAVYGGDDHRTPLSLVTATEPSAKINGLHPDTDYFWTVTAFKNGVASMQSEPCFLHTTGTSGVKAMPNNRIKVNGRTITVIGHASLYDTSGRLMDSTTDGSLQAPSAGIYIVKCYDGIHKIVISN